MGLSDLKQELEKDVKAIISSEFDVEVSEVNYVPTIEDKRITYPNLDSGKMKALKIKTCVLYIDIRKSTELNLAHKPKTLTKLYAAFMRSMVKAAQYYGGHVRNIIGDRVMVVFDEENCFTSAVNTAILLNSVGQFIIDKNFTHNNVSFGIGIDYGEMLVSKGGIRKNGENNAPYKSLVWLGRPANVASKLTDLANKQVDIEKPSTEDYLLVWTWYDESLDEEDKWYEISFSEFFEKDMKDYPEIQIRAHNNNIKDFFLYLGEVFNKLYIPKTRTIRKVVTINTPKILMTEEVFLSYKRENEENASIKAGHWILQDTALYKDQRIYGSSLYYVDIKTDS